MKNIPISKKLFILVVISILALISTAITANIELRSSQERFDQLQNEVRKLAERTAKSTIEINEMVASIKARSTSASTGMTKVTDLVKLGIKENEQALKTMSQVETSSEQIMLMTDEVNASIREQSQASTLLAGSVETIAQIAEENSAVAKNTASLASQLDKLSHELSDVIKQYKL